MSADGGCNRSMSEYGSVLYKGELGVKIDLDEANRYLKMAANAGEVDAMKTYAACLVNEKGNDKDELVEVKSISKWRLILET